MNYIILRDADNNTICSMDNVGTLNGSIEPYNYTIVNVVFSKEMVENPSASLQNLICEAGTQSRN